ncbi:MAG: anhydro-N-acetylmuramic acid kinase [Fidelibacterota bacterium]
MTSIWNLHQKTDLNVLGLMSGTSMDGLDICLAKIAKDGNTMTVNEYRFSEYAYPGDVKAWLSRLPEANAETLCRANFTISETYLPLIHRFLKDNEISGKEIDLIGSHGQTIWHVHRHSTLQLGEAAVLAEAFTVPVVSDFRVRDIAAGGSGAPLVPFVDFLLFQKLQKNLMVLNIGGIANFTLIPVRAESAADIYALDTGPGNSLIDLAVRMYTDGRETFDRDGKIARTGRIRRDILAHLMEHPYIRAEMPKSTGREVFGQKMLTEIVQRFMLERSDFPDLIMTLTRFTADSIYSNYQQFFANKYPIDEIIVSGGGVENPVLTEHLKADFAGVSMKLSDDYGVGSAAKEALTFALLAAAAIWGIPGNVPNVTGAAHAVVLGKISL